MLLEITDRPRRANSSTGILLSDRDDPGFRKRCHNAVVLESPPRRKEVRAMETLVLNPGYEPVARVPWQRAVTLLFLGKVEVVDEYVDREIRSVTFVFKMPSIVRLLRALR